MFPIAPWGGLEKQLSNPGTMFPPLPRTFLASLLIVTKLLQDRAYSNKAWAKLSGLPAQEIGECERALGGALRWRVWVGKDLGKTSNMDMIKTPEGSEMEVEVEGEDFVHGMEDALGDALMAAAAETQLPSQVSTTALLAPSSLALRSTQAGWSRAKSWPILGQLPLPTASADSQQQSISQRPWVAEDFIDFAGHSESAEWAENPMVSSNNTLSTGVLSLPIVQEPTSIAHSFDILRALLEEQDSVASAASTVPSTVVQEDQLHIAVTAPSTPEVAINSINMTAAGNAPNMSMCGSFMQSLQSSPLQMGPSLAPFPFTFVATPDHRFPPPLLAQIPWPHWLDLHTTASSRRSASTWVVVEV